MDHSVRSASAPPEQRPAPGDVPQHKPSPLGAAAAAFGSAARRQASAAGGTPNSGSDSGSGRAYDSGQRQRNAAAPAVGPAHAAALAAVQKKLVHDGRPALDEYDRICRPSQLDETPCTVGEARENTALNRYFNVLPFDFNRVRLQGDGPTYINASELRSKAGESPPWAYIATQGPLPGTAAEFWRCVWGLRTGVVLMLTRETEAGTRKCHSYLPPAVGEYVHHGLITVRLEEKREVDKDITHRVLRLGNTESGEEARRVDHFQYHAWPDHGVPRTTRPLRALARLLEDSDAHGPGPAFVHCSAGIGRTGTFCTVDIALRRLRALAASDVDAATEAVKVKRIVSRLRKQRAGMVQTPEQYLFCYQALREELEEALAGKEAAGGTGSAPPVPPQPVTVRQWPPPNSPLPRDVPGDVRGQGSGLSGQGSASIWSRQTSLGGTSNGDSSPRSSASGQSPPRIPGSLKRRPSGAGGWAGLLGGASTAADPWAALTRTSTQGQSPKQ